MWYFNFFLNVSTTQPIHTRKILDKIRMPLIKKMGQIFSNLDIRIEWVYSSLKYFKSRYFHFHKRYEIHFLFYVYLRIKILQNESEKKSGTKSGTCTVEIVLIDEIHHFLHGFFLYVLPSHSVVVPLFVPLFFQYVLLKIWIVSCTWNKKLATFLV